MGSLYGRLLSEDDGSTTKVTYNGRDKIVMAGTVDGKASTITLTRASDGTIGWAVSDNLDEDLSEELEYDAEAEKAKYNEGRVDGFLEWNDGLDELTVSMAADKREIRATEDSNELNLDNLKGESRTWNCSPPRKQKTLTLHNSSPFPDIKRSITVRRSQSIIINNYAIHNFSDGSDKGGSGEIGGGVSSTKSTSYTTSDYDTVNDSVGVLARVHYMFAHPTRGSKGNGIAGDGLEDAVVTSRGAFSPNLQAVWKVDKSCWQKNGVQRKMISQLVWSDAIAQGNICAYWVTVREEKQEDYPDFTSQYAFTLQPPMHFALGKKNVVANKEAQTYAFTILSEGNWSTEMSAATASWCSLSETSGGPTNGGNEKQMMLQMTENNTGRIRRGEIKFKLNSGGQKETHTLTVEQAPTSKIIN